MELTKLYFYVQVWIMDMLAPLPPSLPPSVLCSMGSGTAGAMLFLYHIIIRAAVVVFANMGIGKGGREGGSWREL